MVTLICNGCKTCRGALREGMVVGKVRACRTLFTVAEAITATRSGRGYSEIGTDVVELDEAETYLGDARPSLQPCDALVAAALSGFANQVRARETVLSLRVERLE